MRQNLQKKELLPALRAWAYLIGAGEPLPETLPASLGWLKARWEAGDEFLPLFLVHDLGYLLLRGAGFRFASASALGHWPESERALRLAYEDRVLGRWALDPTLTAMHVELAGMAPEHREQALAHAVGLALSRPLAPLLALPAGNPAHLRGLSPGALLPPSPEEWPTLLDEEWVFWAKEQLLACVEALSTGRLFGDEDIWEVAHYPELPSESARLALRQIHTTAAKIGKVLPSVALSVERRAQEVPVDQDTSDAYPAGGFDALSTRGTFENIVRTEVAYVGEGATEVGGVDLFDIRFVEGELLYYTRDESPLLDQKREITLVIDRPSELRYKLPALPSQTLVLVEGVGLVFQSDLVHIFGPAGSHVRFFWRTETKEDEKAAEEERALMALALKSEIAHQRVELGITSSWSEVPEPARVVFSPRPPLPRLEHSVWVRVGGESWQAFEEELPLTEGYEALRALVDRLLLVRR